MVSQLWQKVPPWISRSLVLLSLEGVFKNGMNIYLLTH